SKPEKDEPIKTSISELTAEFKANPNAMEAKYGSKRVSMTGHLFTKIKTDAGDWLVVMSENPGSKREAVVCRFDSGGLKPIEKLGLNQRSLFSGTVDFNADGFYSEIATCSTVIRRLRVACPAAPL